MLRPITAEQRLAARYIPAGFTVYREIYRHGAEYFIDVVNKDFYRVFVGDF